MSKEAKPGEAIDFQVGDKTLTVEPIPFGNVKKLFRIVGETIGDMTKENGEAVFQKVPRIMEEKVTVILPLLFRESRYDFLTPDWIDENMTVIDIRSIIETAIKVNGFEDFFAKLGSRFSAPPQASPDESTVKPTVS